MTQINLIDNTNDTHMPLVHATHVSEMVEMRLQIRMIQNNHMTCFDLC